MNTAISIYEGGDVYTAREVCRKRSYLRVRLACPGCLEPVILKELRRRGRTCFFSHYPRKPDSPKCPLRSTSGGGDRLTYLEMVEQIRAKRIFESALLETYQISRLNPIPKSLEEIINRLIKLMQNTNLKKGIDIYDLPLISQTILKDWSSPDKLVQGFRFWSNVINKNFKDIKLEDSYLQNDRHFIIVLLLWKQLHLSRAEGDLRFLLQVTWQLMDDRVKRGFIARSKSLSEDHLFSNFAGAILYRALAVLSLVPWYGIQLSPGYKMQAEEKKESV
jgi:hypothetical protein